MIQLALNENRKEQRVPHSLETILEAALAGFREGAECLHVHIRYEAGNETFSPRWTDAQISLLMTHLPHVPIGISTAAWIEPDLSRRLAHIGSWRRLPDYVSVNYDEPG